MDTNSKANDEYKISIANSNDLEQIIALLKDDVLGRVREQDFTDARADYEAAFADIDRSPDNSILLLKTKDSVIACLQITMIPNLTFAGAKRCQIEGVRVARNFQGRGVGQLIMRHAIDRAKALGCKIVQLTSNNTRSDALRFYEKLGFEATHAGFKLYL